MTNVRDHAIVVGISHYKPLTRLQGAVNDAHCFRDWLIDPGGGDVPLQNVALIVSSAQRPGVAPTQQQVEDAMLVHVRQYRQTNQRQRRLYIFLSGHGVTSEDPGDLDDCRVLMADASLDAIARNIGVRTAGNLFQRTAIFEEIVLFSDCCRELTSPFANSVLSIRAATAPLMRGAAGMNVELLYAFATRWAQLARERELPACDGVSPPYFRGRFTYALLDGLRRAVDPSGAVTKASLRSYVDELVQRLSGNSQVPEIGGSDVIILARPGPAPDVRVLVKLLDPTKGFQVRSGVDLGAVSVAPIMHRDPDLFEIALPAGRYAIASPGDVDDASWRPLNVMGSVVHVEI